jgi:hypothetical protein
LQKSLIDEFSKNLIEQKVQLLISYLKLSFLGKARRLKQAKDEATEEIEKYRGEREKQFKEFENKVIFLNKHK